VIDRSDVLREIGAALEAAGIPFMIVGSFASGAYGSLRTTRDIDIVIEPTRATLDTFLGALDLDRFYVDADAAHDALRRRSMFNVIDIESAWKVDLVIRKDRAFSIEELARRAPRSIASVELPTATAEDTIIAKLEWAKLGASERQLADVREILLVHRTDLDFAYIARWVAELGLHDEWQRVQSNQ